MLRGAPGIGKSALLEAATAHALATEVAVSGTSGVQSETHLPFAGLYQLVHPLLASAEDLPVRQREALLSAFGMVDAASPNRSSSRWPCSTCSARRRRGGLSWWSWTTCSGWTGPRPRCSASWPGG